LAISAGRSAATLAIRKAGSFEDFCLAQLRYQGHRADSELLVYAQV